MGVRKGNSAQSAKGKICWVPSQGFENRWTGWVDSEPFFTIAAITDRKGSRGLGFYLESKIKPDANPKSADKEELKHTATKQLQKFVINAGLQFAAGYSTAHHTAQAESKTDTPKVGGAA